MINDKTKQTVKKLKYGISKTKFQTDDGYFTIIDYDFDVLYNLDAQNYLINNFANELKNSVTKISTRSSTILVVGLGNVAMVADSLGVKSCNYIITSEGFNSKLFAIKTGIENVTGVETAEIVQALTKKINPDVVILIDSYVASNKERLGQSLQISTNGLVAGAGLGKIGQKMDYDFLKVPVVCIGVPVIVDSSTICSNSITKNLVLTLKDIDEVIDKNSKIIGYGINLAFLGVPLGQLKKVFE